MPYRVAKVWPILCKAVARYCTAAIEKIIVIIEILEKIALLIHRISCSAPKCGSLYN